MRTSMAILAAGLGTRTAVQTSQEEIAAPRRRHGISRVRSGSRSPVRRARRISYASPAISPMRYRRYLRPSASALLSSTNRRGPGTRLNAPSSARSTPPKTACSWCSMAIRLCLPPGLCCDYATPKHLRTPPRPSSPPLWTTPRATAESSSIQPARSLPSSSIRTPRPDQRAIRVINSGIYCFRADLLWKHLPEVQPNNASGEFYLTDMAAILRSHDHRVEAMHVDDPSELLGINTRIELAAADRLLRQRKSDALMLSGVTIERPETVTIDAHVKRRPGHHHRSVRAPVGNHDRNR